MGKVYRPPTYTQQWNGKDESVERAAGGVEPSSELHENDILLERKCYANEFLYLLNEWDGDHITLLQQ